jgi:hypothetical protein
VNYVRPFDALQSAARCAAKLAAGAYESESQTVANLIAYLHSAADSFGLEVVPKSDGER